MNPSHNLSGQFVSVWAQKDFLLGNGGCKLLRLWCLGVRFSCSWSWVLWPDCPKEKWTAGAHKSRESHTEKQGDKDWAKIRYTDFIVHIKSIEFSVQMDSGCMSRAKLDVLFDQNGKNSLRNFKLSGCLLLWRVFVYAISNSNASNIPQETGILDIK